LVAKELNDAELGWANLQQAMRDPQLMSEVAEMMRDPENLGEAAKMLSSPEFQEQAARIRDEMKATGTIPDFLTLEYYGERALAKQAEVNALSSLLFALSPTAGKRGASNPKVNTRHSNAQMETLADLEKKAAELNPVVGYFDPLGLARLEFWGQSNEATIGFLRHSEIKHGRAAMMGFIGYMVHENGIRWPFGFGKWGPPYSQLEGLSAPDVWDKCGWFTKLSLIAGIGALEWWGEAKYSVEQFGGKHYMRGGKPGYFPPLKNIPINGRTIDAPLDYMDPLGNIKTMTDEQKARGLNVELNNGRLAMLGLMSLISEARVPGSVPALKGVVKPYSGNVMSPFEKMDTPKLFQADLTKWKEAAKTNPDLPGLFGIIPGKKKAIINVWHDLFPFFFGDGYVH